MKKLIKIGTRKSKLALIQTDLVKRAILQKFPYIEVELVEISTKGDEQLDRSLISFGGKGVFTKELEEQLLSGKIDFAVHSAKDMPMEFPDGLCIGAVLERENPADVVLTMSGTRLRDLPFGAIVGTSSLRRELQIKKINKDVEVRMLRGNVQTRIKKLKEGQYDAILLAAAGLIRLGCEKEEGLFFEYLDEETFLPAAGQGILAVESRKDDLHLQPILSAIHSKEAAALLEAERAYLKEIGGSCNAPAAALCKKRENEFYMKACFAKDAKHLTFESETIKIESEEKQSEAARRLGQNIAKKIKEEKETKIEKETKKGKVYLVGAGPGDIGLFTQRGMELIKKADVIVYDNLASVSILNEARENAELIYAGKRASNHHLKQEETNEVLVKKALEGKSVVRLKGGDPYVFGRGAEEAQALSEHGISFVVVPGISSSYSVPAYCGVPVTHRNIASSFHVVTGHEGSHKDGREVINYEVLAKEEGTLIFLMGLKNLPNIVKNLIRCGKDENTSAAVMQGGTTARQKMAVGTLLTIEEEVKKKEIKTPAIIVVGDVVKMANQLDWMKERPLLGKKVLVTATRPMARKIGELLVREGAEPVLFSLIMTKPKIEENFKKAMEQIGEYTWIVLTSANGVRILFDTLREQRRDIRILSNIKFAVIGEGTKKALEERGIFAEHMSGVYSSKDLAKSMLPLLKKEDNVLLLRAKEASAELEKQFDENEICYNAVALYETKVDERKKEELNRIVSDVDYVTFASASAVKAFAAMASEENKNCCAHISIGPVTSKAAEKVGVSIDKTATEYTAQGMIEALKQ